jgi:hypothetical protein
VTDLPAVLQGKERGHDSVVTGKVTEAVVGVEVPQVVSEERKAEPPESTVPSSVVGVVVVLVVAAVVALEAVPLVLLQSRVFTEFILHASTSSALRGWRLASALTIRNANGCELEIVSHSISQFP